MPQSSQRFVDKAEIDSRYWEKLYYLTPDGDDAGEAIPSFAMP